MNFREGVRRVFVVIGILVAMLVAGITAAVKEPKVDYYSWSQFIRLALQSRLGPEDLNRLNQGFEYNPKGYVLRTCSTQELRQTIDSACKGVEEQVAELPRQWVFTGVWALVFACLAYCFVYVSWRVFDWIFAGFGRSAMPRNQGRP